MVELSREEVSMIKRMSVENLETVFMGNTEEVDLVNAGHSMFDIDSREVEVLQSVARKMDEWSDNGQALKGRVSEYIQAVNELTDWLAMSPGAKPKAVMARIMNAREALLRFHFEDLRVLG